MNTRVPGFNPKQKMKVDERLMIFLNYRFLNRVNPWVYGGTMELYAPLIGTKPSHIARTLRKLAEDGFIARMEDKKGHVMYRSGNTVEVEDYEEDYDLEEEF